MLWKPILTKTDSVSRNLILKPMRHVLLVQMSKQSGTRKLHAIEYVVEDGFLVITHARGYESPNDIGSDNYTVINFTELTALLKPSCSQSSKSN